MENRSGVEASGWVMTQQVASLATSGCPVPHKGQAVRRRGRRAPPSPGLSPEQRTIGVWVWVRDTGPQHPPPGSVPGPARPGGIGVLASERASQAQVPSAVNWNKDHAQTGCRHPSADPVTLHSHSCRHPGVRTATGCEVRAAWGSSHHIPTVAPAWTLTLAPGMCSH